jgi:hypothetical protein
MNIELASTIKFKKISGRRSVNKHQKLKELLRKKLRGRLKASRVTKRTKN